MDTRNLFIVMNRLLPKWTRAQVKVGVRRKAHRIEVAVSFPPLIICWCCINKSIQQRIDDASYLSSIAWNSLAADEQTDRPKVKQVWIVVIIFWGAVTNTTAHHLGQYSLHLLPLKSSMYRVRRRRYFDRVTATAQISDALVMLAF